MTNKWDDPHLPTPYGLRLCLAEEDLMFHNGDISQSAGIWYTGRASAHTDPIFDAVEMCLPFNPNHVLRGTLLWPEIEGGIPSD